MMELETREILMDCMSDEMRMIGRGEGGRHAKEGRWPGGRGNRVGIA